jgi:hypothetical protein
MRPRIYLRIADALSEEHFKKLIKGLGQMEGFNTYIENTIRVEQKVELNNLIE